jgi:hypothetical protein
MESLYWIDIKKQSRVKRLNVKSKVKIPERWKTSDKQIKKMQLAFEFEDFIEKQLKQDALDNGISPSSQLRKILGLHYDQPLKPRLTISLTSEDRDVLAKRYNIELNDRAYLRLGISREIEAYYIQSV